MSFPVQDGRGPRHRHPLQRPHEEYGNAESAMLMNRLEWEFRNYFEIREKY
jgi:hypothetical protein